MAKIKIKKRKTYKTATMKEVFQWIQEGIFAIKGDQVFKGAKKLTQRINKRNRSEKGDQRVDLYHDGKRRSCHVSQLVWMSETKTIIPKDFEIHHRDENPSNNDFINLICLHREDHTKIHYKELASYNPNYNPNNVPYFDDVPF